MYGPRLQYAGVASATTSKIKTQSYLNTTWIYIKTIEKRIRRTQIILLSSKSL